MIIIIFIIIIIIIIIIRSSSRKKQDYEGRGRMQSSKLQRCAAYEET